MKVVLTVEDALILLRCLNYGEAAVSKVQVESGEADIIQKGVQRLRKNVNQALYSQWMELKRGIANPQG